MKERKIERETEAGERERVKHQDQKGGQKIIWGTEIYTGDRSLYGGQKFIEGTEMNLYPIYIICTLTFRYTLHN